jgi:hypothetical protein
MSLTDEFCKSRDLRKEEQKLCYEFASYFQDMIADLERKGHLRSELKVEGTDKERMKFMNVLWNTRKVTHAFNMFFDMYVDKIKPDSRQRLRRFLELNKPYGLTEEDLRYLLYSEMILVFLQNAEEFRYALLFILKLPIHCSIRKDGKEVNNKTALGTLLSSLMELGIKKADKLGVIDYRLRNGLSHGLFWFDEKADEHDSKPHLHYSEDISFKRIGCINLADLYLKMRNQSIYTNCLLNVIGDWFE